VKGFNKFRCRIFPLIILISCVLACGESREKKPDYILSQQEMVKALADYILSQQEMVKALADIYIAEQKVSRLSLRVDSAALVFGSMEKKVFENLNVPDSVFRASVDYYMDHPDEMEMIYAVLIDSLQLREQRVPPAIH
jgi:hypothetical protein